MTTPNIEELIDRLRDPQTRGTTGEWFDRAVAADLLQSQAERIAELDSLAANAIVAAADSQKAYMKLLDENFALRAQLAAIAATEPVGDGYTTTVTIGDTPSTMEQKRIQVLGVNVFARPKPAQDVTELVDALEDAVKLNSFREFNDHIPAMRIALSKYKGAK